MSGWTTWAAIGAIAVDVLAAVGPLALLFVVFQLLFLKLPRRQVAAMLAGIAVAAAGLLLFLAGVAIAYVPVGRAIGAAMVAVDADWLLVSAGLALGLATAWGEPAVRILAEQVEEASAGSIRRPLVVATVCVGVAVGVVAGLLRIAHGIPILYLLMPGYALVVAAMWFSDRNYVAIAVDAGGLATGPLANTFLLAIALGASAGLGDEDPVAGGFGLAALVSVGTTLSVIALGLLIRRGGQRGADE